MYHTYNDRVLAVSAAVAWKMLEAAIVTIFRVLTP